MFTRRLITAAFSAAILAVLATTSVQAGISGHRTTYVTFNRSVAIPGAELDPGEYIFELAVPEQMNLVRVLSRDRRHIYLTAFTMMVERPAQVDSKPQVSFHETVGGVSPAIKAWFPQDDEYGRQFIYR